MRLTAFVVAGLLAASCTSRNDEPAPTTQWRRVPFTSLGVASGTPMDLWVDTGSGRSRLESGGRRLQGDIEGIPLALESDGSREVAVVRQVPTGELTFLRWDRDASPTQVDMPGQDDVGLMLRASLRVGDLLYLVVYDNHALTNRLEQYDWNELDLRDSWTLPSLEDPAGLTYEMEPPVTLVGTPDGALHVIGGTLHATLRDAHLAEDRLHGCGKALEAAADEGDTIGVLCETGDGGFTLFSTDEGTSDEVDARGVPYGLRADPGSSAFVWSDSADTGPAALLVHEIEHGQNSGTLELGANNREGRVAWSQIYYLNGFLDAIAIDARGQFDRVYRDIVDELAERTRIELDLLDHIVATEGFESWCFTVDRSPALFAVQTSRLALLHHRYRAELADAAPLPAIAEVAAASPRLAEHEEVVADDGMPGWLDPGTAYLRWPRGSEFSFDGINVPFNHQNEWALGVLVTGDAETPAWATAAATEILAFFYDHVLAPHGGQFPPDGSWPYWWGVAWDGWTADRDLSVNRPSYDGDHGPAWITFRSIDAAAQIEWSSTLPADEARLLRTSAAQLVTKGMLLPQVAGPLTDHGVAVALDRDVVGTYGRATTPSELPDLVWAHVLPQQG